MSDKIVHLTDENFQSEVLESDKPVLLDFWAPRCGPCRMVGAVLEELVNEMNDIKFCKIDVDEYQVQAIKYQIMSIPTLMVIQNGEVVGKHVGAMNKADLVAFIQSSLGS